MKGCVQQNHVCKGSHLKQGSNLGPLDQQVMGRFSPFPNRSLGCFGPIPILGHFRLGHFGYFRSGLFQPNFGGSVQPTSFYTVLKGNKKFFCIPQFFLCRFIDNKKSFFWLPHLFLVFPPEMEKGMVIFFKKGHFSAQISKSRALWALLLVGASTVGILYCFSVFQ